MTDQGSIKFTTQNQITTIEFYHPKGNSLPGSLLRGMAEKIEEAGIDDKSRIVVLRSEGDGAFCGGASFDELLEISNLDEGKHFFMGFAHVLNAMRTCPKLIITRVQGKAVGGGIGLVAAADYALAHNTASIKLSELALGIGPFVVGPAVGRKIGVSAFSTLTLGARTWYDAKWAESKGLYNRVVDSIDELDSATEKLASELASANPEAMKEFKQIMWQSTGHWESTLEQFAELSGSLVLSDFTRKYIQDFKKK